MDSGRDGGPPEAGAQPGLEPNDRFFRSLVENANDIIAAFDDEGTFGYVSAASGHLLGRSPSELVGQSFATFMHPDDVDRALFQMAQAVELDSAPGNAVFRLRHADGSWVPLDISAGRATDGARTWFVVHCRLATNQQAESETLVRLLNGEPLRAVLAPVLESFSWRELDSHIAIAWTDGGQREHVSTGLPDLLCGTSDDGPWAKVRESGQPVLRSDLTELPDAHRAAAEAHGRGGYWIEPVRTGGEPALISAWTAIGHEPAIHEYGMGTARRYVDVVLQFTAQRRALDHAASHDPLTGLANRKALLEAIDAERAGGAVLYCDLDRFKPVNDELGHGAGDELLGLVAQRLRSCVRDGDLVARFGGDEFVVLCGDIDRARTEAVAQRVLDALLQPFSVGQNTIEIGASIGMALEHERITEATLDAADRALYTAKSAGRGVFRWAPDA